MSGRGNRRHSNQFSYKGKWDFLKIFDYRLQIRVGVGENGICFALYLFILDIYREHNYTRRGNCEVKWKWFGY